MAAGWINEELIEKLRNVHIETIQCGDDIEKEFDRITYIGEPSLRKAISVVRKRQQPTATEELFKERFGSKECNLDVNFEHELRVQSLFTTLSHENLAKCSPIRYVFTKGWGIRMEYFPEGSLWDISNDFGDDVRLDLLRGTASGLAFMHSHGFAHCDVKPDNVCIAQELNGHWTAKIIDFETTYPLGWELRQDEVGLGGALAYRSPEMWSQVGEEPSGIPVRTSIDAWAYGICLLQVMAKTTVLPWEMARSVYAEFQHFLEQTQDGSQTRCKFLIPAFGHLSSLPDWIHTLLRDLLCRRADDRLEMLAVVERINENFFQMK